MRRMSFELSFLRQSYICAPALSAGQVDGIKFRSGPDRNFLLFPRQIPRGYISWCEQSVTNRRAWPRRKLRTCQRWSRIDFRRCIRTRYKGYWAARSTLQLRLDPFYRLPVSLILKHLSKCSLSKNDIREKKMKWKKVSRNLVIISFPIDICVHALRSVREEWRSMNVDAINERESFHFWYTWRRYDPWLDGKYWQTRNDEGLGNRSTSSTCSNSGWLFNNEVAWSGNESSCI